jgi:hypothetical protein
MAGLNFFIPGARIIQIGLIRYAKHAWALGVRFMGVRLKASHCHVDLHGVHLVGVRVRKVAASKDFLHM